MNTLLYIYIFTLLQILRFFTFFLYLKQIRFDLLLFICYFVTGLHQLRQSTKHTHKRKISVCHLPATPPLLLTILFLYRIYVFTNVFISLFSDTFFSLLNPGCYIFYSFNVKNRLLEFFFYSKIVAMPCA